MTVQNDIPARNLRVLVVEDDTLVGMAIKSHLQRLGHTFVGQAANSTDAMEIYRNEKPDLVLLDIRLNGSDGIELAGSLMAERRCPMIVVSAYSDPDLVDRASAAGVFGYLIKPITTEGLAAQIEVARRRFAELEQLRQENETLAQALETRKLVEKAKGILMKRMGLTEDAAHQRLQHESQRRRIRLPDLARKVIESEELLGGQM